jgi:hypothetical protein
MGPLAGIAGCVALAAGVGLSACETARSRMDPTPAQSRTQSIERQCRAEADLQPEDARSKAYQECTLRYYRK